MSPAVPRAAAIGGIAGPAAFVGGWVVGGLRTDGYSPISEAISRLAADGAPTQPLMTAGFLGFSAGVSLHALALRGALGGPSWAALLVSAAATAGVAATPLDSGVDGWHGLAAGVGYASLAAAVALAVPPLRRAGRRRAAQVSAGVAATASALLVGTLVTEGVHGLLQRTGLTLLDAWLVASAVAVLRRRAEGGAQPLAPRVRAG